MSSYSLSVIDEESGEEVGDELTLSLLVDSRPSTPQVRISGLLTPPLWVHQTHLHQAHKPLSSQQSRHIPMQKSFFKEL